jgi:hypothetical protein
MGWGTVFLDYDNDGHSDIYVSNDTYFAPFDNLLYRNLGNTTFEVVSEGTPLSSPMAGYGVATGDVNSDGKPDLLLVNAGSQDGNQLFLNSTENGHHFVKVRLRGTESNTAAIGARVTLEANGQVQMDEVCAGMGYASQNSFTLHFGLGDATLIDRLSIRWPNGMMETYEGLAVDQHYFITEGEGMVTNVSSIAEAASELKIWPNPAKERLYIQVNGEDSRKKEALLRVFSSTGTEVYRAQVAPGRVWELPLNNWPAGTYWVHWAGAYRQHVRQFVKP